MWLVHSPQVSLYLSTFPEHTDTSVTSWQPFKNSVLVDKRLVHLQRLVSSHYLVLTVVVYGKMGKMCLCALGVVLKNSVMSMENIVFVTQYNKQTYQFTVTTLRTQTCS